MYAGRGGFEKMRTQGETGPIEFEVYYRERRNIRPITYEIAIEGDEFGRPYVSRECLRQKRKGQNSGRPFSFLILGNGRGVAWKREWEGRLINNKMEQINIPKLIKSIKKAELGEAEIIELEDRRKLGIATLGALKQHPRISAICRFIKGWHLSYFTPDAARSLPVAGPQEHLSIHGDNLGNVAQFMERKHPLRFRTVLERIAGKIPDLERIDTQVTEDDRLLLRFKNKGFQDPIYARQVSDGTLKLFAYLLLLEDPEPAPLLCIKDPGKRPVSQAPGEPGERVSRTGRPQRLSGFYYHAPAVLRRFVRAGRSLDSGKGRRWFFDDLPGKRRCHRKQHGRGRVVVGRSLVL